MRYPIPAVIALTYTDTSLLNSLTFLLACILQEERLLELVPQHLIPSHWSTQKKAMTKECTDWTAIGRELGRVPKNCSAKYYSIRSRQLKKGPFTAKEDALIRKRVREWGDKGNGLYGLWTALEKEMGRAGLSISERWLIQRDLNSMHWTDEMVYSIAKLYCCYYRYYYYNLFTLLQDLRLTEGVEQHKAESWAEVAEFMGDGLSAEHCKGRWNHYLETRQRGLSNGNWQPDEVPHPTTTITATTTIFSTDTSLAQSVLLACLIIYDRRSAYLCWCHSILGGALTGRP